MWSRGWRPRTTNQAWKRQENSVTKPPGPPHPGHDAPASVFQYEPLRAAESTCRRCPATISPPCQCQLAADPRHATTAQELSERLRLLCAAVASGGRR